MVPNAGDDAAESDFGVVSYGSACKEVYTWCEDVASGADECAAGGDGWSYTKDADVGIGESAAVERSGKGATAYDGVMGVADKYGVASYSSESSGFKVSVCGAAAG